MSATLTHDNTQPVRVLRLIIAPTNHDLLPYSPFPSATVDLINEVFKLEKDYLSSSPLQTPSMAFEVPLENGYLGFVMKSSRWNDDITDFSLPCVSNSSTMHSSCIMRTLTKNDLKQFKERLKAAPTVAWYPCFIAAILLEMRLQKLPKTTSDMRRDIRKIELDIGTYRRHYASESKSRELDQKWKHANLGYAAAELTAIATDCAYNEAACISRRRLVQWLGALHTTYQKTKCVKAENIISRMMKQKVEFMEMWAIESEGKMTYLELQMCSNLLAQRDNALNQQTAKSSLDTADRSLKISENTKKDSANMRTVAIVTLWFLSGTFMATLFSTGFFNFRGDGPIVSHWFWLYCLFTTVLTVAVFLTWSFADPEFRKKMREKMRRHVPE
ncbi:hypothetical protein CC86DRAFT_404530 [Ophiobolus disseminans]|uniref:Uncharacterized protein n=1 Tax=Ophiobolus disseminans TaxID=1469910 RepID=A0A6A7A771_9PLEO|nr:hypothetical protein CC86DRAFT_404530 [Ophiobolus disseminans]